MARSMTTTLWQIQAPHMTAGFIAENNLIVEAAPIIRWTVGKTVLGVKEYALRKRWKLIQVKDRSGPQ